MARGPPLREIANEEAEEAQLAELEDVRRLVGDESFIFLAFSEEDEGAKRHGPGAGDSSDRHGECAAHEPHVCEGGAVKRFEPLPQGLGQRLERGGVQGRSSKPEGTWKPCDFTSSPRKTAHWGTPTG